MAMEQSQNGTKRETATFTLKILDVLPRDKVTIFKVSEYFPDRSYNR